MSFDSGVRAALADGQLRGALRQATTLFGERRRAALATVPDWEEARDRARAIKDETLLHLDRYLEQFAASAERAGARVHWARDAAEAALNDLIEEMLASAPPSEARTEVAALQFDPADAFTNSIGPRPLPDLEAAEMMVAEFAQIVRDLRLLTEENERLLAAAQRGLDFLIDAREARRYAFDFEQLAAEAFDGDVAAAERAAGLFNAYCARCHTAGYSAGMQFRQEAGSGAFGPSLRAGRSIVQFPDPEDHLEFIIAGSEEGVRYGVNGIGRGWMPGFGAVLTEEDLRLIVALERALP